MADETDYVEDAHAMEQNDLKMLDSMISIIGGPQVEGMLQNHERETEENTRGACASARTPGAVAHQRESMPRRWVWRTLRAWGTWLGVTRRLLHGCRQHRLHLWVEPLGHGYD